VSSWATNPGGWVEERRKVNPLLSSKTKSGSFFERDPDFLF